MWLTNLREQLSEKQEQFELHIWNKQFVIRGLIALFIVVAAVGTAFYFWPEQSKAASVGPRFATASGDCISTTGIGTIGWTNPGNAYDNDGVAVATAALARNAQSTWLKCTNFGFTTAMIPTGSTINGIVVSVKRSVSTSNATTTDNAMRLVKSNTIGTIDRKTTTAWPTTLTVEDHGGAADLWGDSWTVTDITSSTFGAAISAIHGGTGNSTFNFNVDSIGITVYFTEPVWSNITQRQGVITNDQNNSILASHTAKIGERLRIVTQVDTNSGRAKNRIFKLQYDKNDGSWSDVRPTGEIRPAKSSILGLKTKTGTGLAGTCTAGATPRQGFVYQLRNRTASIPINGSSCQDIGFVIDTKNATAGTTYRFRLYDLTGNSTLNTYAAYPSFTTVSSGADTIRASKSNTTSLASNQADLKGLLDNQGYTNINTDDVAREILQNAANDTTADWTTNGGAANDQLGSAAAAAGDVNGDGYDDVIIGAPGYSSSTGRAFIYYGGPIFDTTADVTLTGEAANNFFGSWVARAGDVNGDGYGDVVVGAYGYSTTTGRAYIYFGGPTMDSTVDVTLTGEATSNRFGIAVDSAGDVNGDGYADIIVGAFGYSSSTGRAYIYFGGASMDSVADVTMTGEATNNRFGIAAAGAGDVNGDGYGDVVVGADGFTTNFGKSYIYYGGSTMDNTADLTMTNSVAEQFGISVDGAGDINGDGYGDVIVGAYKNTTSTGKAYIYYGGATMNNTVDVTLTGEATNTEFGFIVSGLGDINGDGYADVMVGAHGFDNSGISTDDWGKGYIFYGGSSMDSTADLSMLGEAISDHYGYSLASAGDVNGDGCGDVIVGAYGKSSSAGKAYIYFQTYQINGTADRIMTGEAASNDFGYSGRSAGDVNGDGYNDLIIGAYGYNANTGRAYIYFGGPLMDAIADLTFTGLKSPSDFGKTVAPAGDFNGDGYDDIVIGAPAWGVTGSANVGQTYIYFGGPNMDTTADITISGETPASYFASKVAAAGDVNGDGFPDVVVGAPGYSSNTGRAYIYYGGTDADGIADITMTGEGAGNNFGSSVSSAGDVNADGYEDIVVGATGHNSSTGKAYVYYGGATMDTVADVTMTGEATSDTFGRSVARAGDLNGDGYADVLVGADQNNANAGRAYVYMGGSTMDNVADLTLSGQTSGDFFGFKAGGSRDINGDGYDDLIVGADGYSGSTGRAYIYFGGPGIDTTADLVITGITGGDGFGNDVSLVDDLNGDGYAEILSGAWGYNGDMGRSYLYFGGSSNYIPTFNLAQKSATACSSTISISASWIGQSSAAASSNNLILQVYRFGSTNAWETVTTNNSLTANTDGTISGSKSTSLSEYCDGSNWSYWRLYQQSGQQSLSTNQFSITFTTGGGPTPTPTPVMDQKIGRGNWWLNGVRQFLSLD